MHSPQQGSLLSGEFILNNSSTKPHYKHTHFITHTQKSYLPEQPYKE